MHGCIFHDAVNAINLKKKKIEGWKRRGRQSMRWLMTSLTQCPWVWVGSGSWLWTRRPGMLQSMGSQRVRHDWATELNWPKLWFSWWRILLQCRRPGFCPWVRKVPWRRERLPTPVFWPREFHELYSPCCHKKSDTAKWLSLHFSSVKSYLTKRSF